MAGHGFFFVAAPAFTVFAAVAKPGFGGVVADFFAEGVAHNFADKAGIVVVVASVVVAGIGYLLVPWWLVVERCRL